MITAKHELLTNDVIEGTEPRDEDWNPELRASWAGGTVGSVGPLYRTRQKQSHHRLSTIHIIPVNDEVLDNPSRYYQELPLIEHFSQVRCCMHSITIIRKRTMAFVKSLWVPGTVPCSSCTLMHKSSSNRYCDPNLTSEEDEA